MNLEKDLEKVFKKHNIQKATVIVEIKPIDENNNGQSVIITMAPTPEEEIAIGKAYEKLSSVCGNLDGEAINAAADVITYTIDLHKNLSDTSISQVTWDKIAHGFAQSSLSPEDYDKLTETVKQKNIATRAQEWETAAQWRKREKEYLQTVWNILINPSENI